MKKLLIIISLFIGTVITIWSQPFTYKWEGKFFSFISPVELTKVEKNNLDDFYWQNDEYTVEITMFGLGYYNTYYSGQNINKVAEQVAIEQSFYDIIDGDSLPLMESGYYVLAKTPGMDESTYASVIVAVGFNERRKFYFEARIYCFNNKYKKGLEMVKSFRFDK